MSECPITWNRPVASSPLSSSDSNAPASSLAKPGANRMEVIKARGLARHLFRSSVLPWAAKPDVGLSPPERRTAERIRAGLAGLVPLGAGLRCVEPAGR